MHHRCEENRTESVVLVAEIRASYRPILTRIAIALANVKVALRRLGRLRWQTLTCPVRRALFGKQAMARGVTRDQGGQA